MIFWMYFAFEALMTIVSAMDTRHSESAYNICINFII